MLVDTILDNDYNSKVSTPGVHGADGELGLLILLLLALLDTEPVLLEHRGIL